MPHTRGPLIALGLYLVVLTIFRVRRREYRALLESYVSTAVLVAAVVAIVEWG